MSDQEIRDYYDSHPNITLMAMAGHTGLTVGELKHILMSGEDPEPTGHLADEGDDHAFQRTVNSGEY